jgi:hypothetical protein
MQLNGPKFKHHYPMKNEVQLNRYGGGEGRGEGGYHLLKISKNLNDCIVNPGG